MGNGPGDADGQGGREDAASANASVSSEPKVVAQADQQRTRERPDASSADEPSRTRPTVPPAADESSQATRSDAATNSRTDPLAKSEAAATKLESEGDKSRD